MSILDRLTDEGLKDLLQVKDVQIAALQARVKFLEDERSRLEKWGQAKSRRIVALTLDLNEAITRGFPEGKRGAEAGCRFRSSPSPGESNASNLCRGLEASRKHEG